MMIFKYVCESFPGATLGNIFDSLVGLFTEKDALTRKFGTVIPVRSDIITKTEKR